MAELTEATPLLTDQQPSQDNSAKKTAKQAKPWYVIVSLFSLMFSFGALLAPLIQFYTVIFCYKYYRQQAEDNDADIPLDNCAIPEVQAIVSEAQAIIMLLSYVSTLLFAGYYGALSDRKGRRHIMLISTVGSIIQILGFILTIKYIDIFGISLLFICPVIKGMLVGDSVLLATAQAYISDCTTPTTRTLAFSRMMASIFIGATLGPTAASYVIKKTGSIVAVFYMVLVVNILYGLFVWLVMPESRDLTNNKVPESSESQTFLQRLNIFSSLAILRKSTSGHLGEYALPILAFIQFLIYIVVMPPSLLYAMLTFGWTAYEGGLFFSLCAFGRVVVMLALLPVLVKLFHRKKAHVTTKAPQRERESSCTSSSSSAPTVTSETDLKRKSFQHSKEEQQEEQPMSAQDIQHAIRFDTWMIRTGLTIETAAFVVFGLVSTSAGFALTGAAQSLALLAAPSLRSLLTSLVHPSKIGELLGAIAVLEACAMILSQLTINTIYSASVATMPNLIFFVCAAIAGMALVSSLFVRPTKPLPDTTFNEV